MVNSQSETRFGKQLMKERAFEIYINETDILIKTDRVTPCVEGVVLSGLIMVVDHNRKEINLKKRIMLNELVWSNRIESSVSEVNKLMLTKLSY